MTDKQESQRLLAVGSILRNDAARILGLISENRDQLEYIEVQLRGGSMGKAIPKRSEIRVDVKNSGPYRPGDIIAFLSDEKIMVHRIFHCSRSHSTSYFLTRGDRSWRPDRPITAESIIGQVVAYKKEGYWIAPGPCEPFSLLKRFVSASLCRIAAFLLDKDPGAATRMVERVHKLFPR